MKRLRLVKVLVQPVFVVDDGECLEERVGEQKVIPAKEWPDFPARLAARAAEAEATINDEPPSTGLDY